MYNFVQYYNGMYLNLLIYKYIHVQFQDRPIKQILYSKGNRVFPRWMP
jgi:hypothetical protein